MHSNLRAILRGIKIVASTGTCGATLLTRSQLHSSTESPTSSSGTKSPPPTPHPSPTKHTFIEYRIPLPLTVEEFHRAHLFMVAEKSKHVSGSGGSDGGVEWITNTPFDNTDGHWGVSAITGVPVPRTRGQYTLKRYHLKSKFPAVVTAMLPKSATYLVEEAWNAYPHMRTVLVSTYFDHDKFHVVSLECSLYVSIFIQGYRHLCCSRMSSLSTYRIMVRLIMRWACRNRSLINAL